MSLVEKYLGKTIVRKYNDKERYILVTEIIKDGKYGYPVIDGILKKQSDGYDTTKIGSKVWCYVDDIDRIITTTEYRESDVK
jgi:hypothetical protein